MGATKASVKDDAAHPAEAEESTPDAPERARARAYLDLWERHVVHMTLYGPAPEPAPGRPPAR